MLRIDHERPSYHSNNGKIYGFDGEFDFIMKKLNLFERAKFIGILNNLLDLPVKEDDIMDAVKHHLTFVPYYVHQSDVSFSSSTRAPKY